jgi:peptidoglycan-associated lipoprotein
MTTGSEEDFILNVGRRTYFAEGSAVLDDTARTTLDKQAEWLLRHPQWLLKLQGFADDPGSAQQNTTLSKKRAEAVMTYLASRGVDRRRMWARGYGKERIVRDCPDISCTSQNRRVISNLRNERET